MKFPAPFSSPSRAGASALALAALACAVAMATVANLRQQLQLQLRGGGHPPKATVVDRDVTSPPLLKSDDEATGAVVVQDATMQSSKSPAAVESILLPPSLAKLKELGFDPKEEDSNSSSSSSSSKNGNQTVPVKERVILRGHKFGFVMVSKLFRRVAGYDPGRVKLLDPGQGPNSARKVREIVLDGEGDADFRVAVVLRNVYSALASGYLYHRGGKECWKNPTSERNVTKPIGMPWTTVKWKRFKFQKPKRARTLNNGSAEAAATATPLPPIRGRSLCQYLIDEPMEVGLRAYTEYVFRTKYRNIFDIRARTLSDDQSLRGRVKYVCFERLSSKDHGVVRRTAEDVLDFLYGDSATEKESRLRASWEYRASMSSSGAHATSHDPELRRRLT